jgi:hypothetical protein
MYKKEYRPNKEYKNTNIPWFNQDRLNPLSLRVNSTAWWNIALWSFTITWTWNISVTWVWFTPKAIRFDVCDQSTSAWTWVMTTTSQYAINFALWTQITTQCIYYGSWVKARAIYVSMDSDWFTINCTFFAATTYVNFTAFW